MRIAGSKFQMKFNKSLVCLLGILFVFLSGCRFHKTKTSENEQKPVSQQNNNIIIKDSVITKPDTLKNQSKQKKDSISPKYNPRNDKQPLYGVKPNFRN